LPAKSSFSVMYDPLTLVATLGSVAPPYPGDGVATPTVDGPTFLGTT